jgi:hypothetical protein
MSEWLKECGCKPHGYAYAGSNPAPPTSSAAMNPPGRAPGGIANTALPVWRVKRDNASCSPDGAGGASFEFIPIARTPLSSRGTPS